MVIRCIPCSTHKGRGASSRVPVLTEEASRSFACLVLEHVPRDTFLSNWALLGHEMWFRHMQGLLSLAKASAEDCRGARRIRTMLQMQIKHLKTGLAVAPSVALHVRHNLKMLRPCCWQHANTAYCCTLAECQHERTAALTTLIAIAAP